MGIYWCNQYPVAVSQIGSFIHLISIHLYHNSSLSTRQLLHLRHEETFNYVFICRPQAFFHVSPRSESLPGATNNRKGITSLTFFRSLWTSCASFFFLHQHPEPITLEWRLRKNKRESHAVNRR